MISLLSAAIGLAVVIMLFRRNRTAFVAGIFILFSLTYRIVDVAYLDLVGPIYAIELGRYVGGGVSTPMFVASCLTFIIPLWLLCRPRKILAGVTGPLGDNPYFDFLARGAFAGCGAVLAIVYLDMLRLGVIPLFAGIDRLEYNDMAGIFHRPLYEMNFLFSAILGTITVLPRLQGRRFAFRFVGLFASLLLYWALTGNRASAFVVSLTFYALPFAAVLAMEATNNLQRMTARDAWSALASAKVVVPLSIIGFLIVMISLLINSYYDVRGYSDPLYQITQRVFVQPVQFWAVIWQDIDFRADFLPSADVFDQVIFNPPNPYSNTTIQYLMSRELGFFRAAELIALGHQYAGGYPEIFFELFGAWLALPMLAVFGTITAATLRLGVGALAKGKVLTSIMAVYIFYGFTLTYIGGMVNFLLAPTFAIKILLLIIALVWERSILNRLLRPTAAGSSAIRLRARNHHAN